VVERKGKRLNLGALVQEGQLRAGGDTQSGEEEVGPRPREGAPAPPAPPPATMTSYRAGPDIAAVRPGAEAASPTVALYVRVQQPAKDRLDDATRALRRDHATNGELVAALLFQEVDPYTPEGLAELRARLQRHRHPRPGA
jgi:hypothetical protein